MPVVILDINILVSSVIAALGFPRQIFSAWRLGHYRLVISAGMIAELEEKLTSPRIARRFSATPELAQDTITLLRDQAIIIPIPSQERQVVTGDPEDDLVLATGRLAQANYLVTGDRGLLDLVEYEGMKIISPRKFAEFLRSLAP